MSDQFVLILVIIGGTVGLLLVGVAIWMMRSETPDRESQSQESPKAEAEVTPPPPPEPASIPAVTEASEPPVNAVASEGAAPLPPPVSTAPSSPPVSASAAPSWLNSLAARNASAAALPLPGGEELARLWRSAEGELVIEVGGKRYRTRQELIEAGVENRVANAAHDLSYLLEGPATAAVSATAAAPGPANGAGTPAKGAPRPVAKVSLEEAAKMEIKRPTMDISKQFRYLRDQQKQPEIQIKTVAEEIDEILQITILGTPLAGRGLKVADSIHGVSFSIDGRNYESVDAIPDDDARSAIRTAIQKWDQK